MRRTLEDIIPPSRRRAMAPTEAAQEDPRAQTDSRPPRRTNNNRPREPRRRFAYTPAIVALVIIILSAVALFMFSGAQVTVDPMTASATVSGTYTASASSTSGLPYKLISSQKLAMLDVSSSGTQTVHTAAEGAITIYNSSSRSVRLVNKTRFQTPDGLIFRIHEAVVVPAGGTRTATVYADAPGAEYNVGPTTFTVPGLKGTSLATKVYAKSKDSMTGGFSGERASVSPTVAANTYASMRTALSKDLMDTIKSKQVPPGYVLLPGAATTTYQTQSTLPGKSAGQAQLREEGTVTAVIFPEGALAKMLASHVSGTYQGKPVTLLDPSTLTLAPVSSIPTAASSANASFDFKLSGNATIVWTVDPGRVASAIAGKTRDQAKTILNNFPEVKQAMLTLHPFWNNTFPSDPSQIKVVVNAPTSTSGN